MSRSSGIKGPASPTLDLLLPHQSAQKNLFLNFLSRSRPSMACRTVLRSVFLTEPWRPLHVVRLDCPSISCAKIGSCSTTKLTCGYGHRVRNFRFSRTQRLNCSTSESPPPSSESPEDDEEEQGPPQEAVLKAISEVSKTEGRVGQTTNVVIGGTVADDSTNEWLALDKKVNTYPTVRGFTAIGTGGDDFVQAMVVAVESVIQQPIPKGHVKQKLSSRGKYVSVNIGPIQVISSEQVQAVYNAMRRDDRMKYFLKRARETILLNPSGHQVRQLDCKTLPLFAYSLAMGMGKDETETGKGPIASSFRRWWTKEHLIREQSFSDLKSRKAFPIPGFR